MSGYDHGGDIFATARRMGIAHEKLIDFSASINPLGMSEALKKDIAGAIDSLSHYPDPYAEPLREALAAYHGISSEEILPSNGSTELIFLLPRLVKGSRAIIIAPAFSEYSKSLGAAGWSINNHILSPENSFDLNLDKLQTRIADRYDMLFFCNPGNPTGRLYSREEIRQVMAMCRAERIFLVLDEAFIDFCGEEASMLSEMVATGAGVVLRSMTKFYAIPGLRLGYAAASADICRQLADISGPWSVNTLAQAAGMSAVADSEYRSRSMELLARERANLFRLLSDIPDLTPYAGVANYLLFRFDNDVPVAALSSGLLKRYGIIIRDCSSFSGLASGFIRVAVRSHEENIFLVKSIKELLIEYHR